MMSSENTVEIENRLIDAVRNETSLWDKSDHNFKNSKAKEASWRGVSEKIGMEAKQCKAQWSGLRAQFMKFLLRLKKPSGSDGRRPFYRHEIAMMFLKGDIEPEENNYSNVTNVEIQQDEIIDLIEYDMSVGTPQDPTTNQMGVVAQFKEAPLGRSHSKSLGKRKLDEFEKDILKTISTEDDEFDTFGKTMARKLRGLATRNRRSYLELQFKINSDIYEAEMINLE